MSLPLKDCRTAIPESTDMWLEIEAQATGADKAAITRDVLNAWAKVKAHAFKVAARRLQANGLQPELFGEDSVEHGGAHGTSRKTAGASR